MLTHGSLFSGIGENHTHLCQVCDKEFTSYNPSPKFCSNKCKSTFQQADIDYKKVVEMYENGHTQDEIATFFNVGQKVIYSAFKRNGYKCRVAAKRDQTAHKNSSWAGKEVTYTAFHYRVYSARGNPSKCDVCGTEHSKRFEWANLSGNYDDVNDYSRMCIKCHRSYDKTRKNSSKHVKRTK